MFYFFIASLPISLYSQVSGFSSRPAVKAAQHQPLPRGWGLGEMGQVPRPSTLVSGAGGALGTVALTCLDVEGEFVHPLLVAPAREAQGDGEGLSPPHHQLLAAHLRRPVLPAVALALQVPRLQNQIWGGSSVYSSRPRTHSSDPRGSLLPPPWPWHRGPWCQGLAASSAQAALSSCGVPGTALGTVAVPGSGHPSWRALQAGLASPDRALCPISGAVVLSGCPHPRQVLLSPGNARGPSVPPPGRGLLSSSFTAGRLLTNGGDRP